jgi:thiol-disulfide isomerase/thioredoxin
MEILQDTDINQTIEESLKKSLSYSEYRKLVEELTIQNSTTGNDKSEALAEYTKLNEKRMKRWDKTLKISQETQDSIKAINKKLTWIVLTESWCGDAAHIVPVINKVAEINGNIDLRLVLRDENEDLMNMFLTNGGKAIPKLIAIEKETGNVINTFGPRPFEAIKLINEYKEKFGTLTPEFKQDLQVWYNKDKGQNTISELQNLLLD